MARCASVVLGAILLLALGSGWGAPPACAEDPAGPSRLELDGAEYRVDKFEERVRREGGKPFPLGSIEKEALARVRSLVERYPENPKVKELFERTKRALMASKGNMLEVTEAMLAYRRIGEILRERFAAVAAKEAEALRALIAAEQGEPLAAWPSPEPLRTDIDERLGKWIVLDDFRYPTNEFSYVGQQYVFVGTGRRGYYYVELSGQAWLGAYEALRRYRHEVGGELPQDLPWRLYGKLRSIALLVPEAGEEKKLSAAWGWTVEPVAIEVPGYTLTLHDPESEQGGRFAGEDQLEAVKGPLLSVRSVPADAEPQQVIEAWITAIKEKNKQLFLDLLDPARKKTPRALSRADYHWELHQRRWAVDYVHAEIGEPAVEVLKGLDEGDEDEGYFLSDEDRKEIEEHAGERMEEARVFLRMFDEHGRQVGRPRPFTLRRYGGARWYVEDPSAPN